MLQQVNGQDFYSFDYKPTSKEWVHHQDLAGLLLSAALFMDFERVGSKSGMRHTHDALPLLQRVTQEARVPGNVADAYPDNQNCYVSSLNYLLFREALGEQKNDISQTNHLLMRFNLFAAELRDYDTLAPERKRNLQSFCLDLHETLRATENGYRRGLVG
ncbi:hypothetical protein HY492_04215 [Candidatus Woesearchaeota archaeon]|nr:hypothetical protein [Candidatus Woesearchaeota archaeon]